MNKLSKKFVFGISMILLFTTTISLLINSFLIEKYYLYEKKQELDKIGNQLEDVILQQKNIKDAASALEESKEVTIVWAKKTENIDLLNAEIQSALRNKGLGFRKFWLWDQDYQIVLKNGRKLSIYNQDTLHYSILVEYMEIDQNIYAVAMIIPHITEAIQIINTVTCIVMAGSLLVAIVLVILMTKRITRPLDYIKQFADDIAAHKFHSIEIHTHDELEIVAASMNLMCSEMERYQNELLDKNQQMEQFLNNVAHDLKTPVALIKAYTGGIKDGLDDGSFMDTIIRQNERMGKMVENLIFLSRIKMQEPYLEEVFLDRMLNQLLEEHLILAEGDNLTFQTDIIEQALLQSNHDMIMLILSNLLSNALKYSSGKIIDLSLKKKDNGYLFEITNETCSNLDLSRLFEAFYVGEISRNKDLSGTGLGLALVKGSTDKMGYPLSCHQSEGKITFRVLFHSSRKL